MSALRKNHCPQSLGISVRFAQEYAVCLDLKQNEEVNIFDHILESYSRSNLRPFLDEFAETLNYFETTAKEKLFAAFIDSKQLLDKFLTLYNSLVSERDRLNLKTRIEDENEDEFMSNARWMPIIESGLIEALNSGVFSAIAEKMLSYFEKHINAKDGFYMKDKKILLFQLKLFMAFRNNDIDKIQKLELPPSNDYSKGNAENINLKIFYEALIYQENKKYTEALNYFNGICVEEPDNIEFILRRLILKCDTAQELIDKKRKIAISKIQDIITETEDVELRIIELQKKNPNLYVNRSLVNHVKAFCFLHLQKFVDFDNLYFNQLTYIEKMQEGFLEYAIKRCIVENLGDKAHELLSEAKKFHILENGQEPAFLLQIRKQLNNKGIEPNLGRLFNLLIEQLPENKIKAVPDIINPEVNHLGDFLLYELCRASKDLLNKISTIQKIIIVNEQLKAQKKDKLKTFEENEITDLLEIILRGRINYLQIPLHIQRRKGGGNNGTGMGMPDGSISLGMKEITLEAVRVYSYHTLEASKTNIINHLAKIFDYSTSKFAFYNIVYYEKPDFNDGWDYFKASIIQECEFTESYSLIGDLKDVTADFGNEAIKVGITEHKNGLRFYHIYLDFMYVKGKQ